MSASSSRGPQEGNVGKGGRSSSYDRDDAIQSRMAQIEHLDESYCLDLFPEGGATLEMKRQTTRVVLDQESAAINPECVSENADIETPRPHRKWRLWLRGAADWVLDALIRRLPNVF